MNVAKSSVSIWVRDVEFDPARRRSAATGRRPRGSDHPLRRRKLAEIERLRVEGLARIGTPSEREFLTAGLGLYAGDGSKGDKEVSFSNSSEAIVGFFCRWLRTFFVIEEHRLRVRLYLHQGLDLEAAVQWWCSVTEIPQNQFLKPYRAVPDATIRGNKHQYGCAHVVYNCAGTQRQIMALMQALLDAGWAPGAGLEPATISLTGSRSAN